MAILQIKCPGCGASVKAKTSSQGGYCEYCGSYVNFESFVLKNNPEIEKIENLLTLASSCTGEPSKAEALYDQVLEIDSKNAQAWKGKFNSIYKDVKRFNEAVNAKNQYVEFVQEPFRHIFAYGLSSDLYSTISGKLLEIGQKTFSLPGPGNEKSCALPEKLTLEELLEMRAQIPAEIIRKDKSLSEEIYEDLQEFLRRNREEISNENETKYRRFLYKWCKGLPSEKYKEIRDEYEAILYQNFLNEGKKFWKYVLYFFFIMFLLWYFFF